MFAALIRTHHITSRKKIAALKKAFTAPQNPGLTLILLRTGASPGMMYVEGHAEDGVAGWVGVVQALRYKDFRVVGRVGEIIRDKNDEQKDKRGGEKRDGREERRENGLVGFREVETVHEFAAVMRARGVEGWWKRAMGYEGQ